MMVALAKQDNVIDFPQKSNEWYTPACYVEAARSMMGGIDLDPASCEFANSTVKATRYYTKEENGLMYPWCGRVWLNPPFAGTQLRNLWTQKLLGEYYQGHVTQAILLMPAAIETAWFQPLWQFPVCFPASRIYFYQDKPRKENPNFASCLVYLGPHEDTFIDIFSQFGTIAKRASRPYEHPINLSLWEAMV